METAPYRASLDAPTDRQPYPRRTNGALVPPGENKPNARTAAPVETSLWTDRYRPKRFIDLLGDEVRSGSLSQARASASEAKSRVRRSASTALPCCG